MDFKSQVLEAVDLVALIGETVALNRRGRDFIGLCPFHQEKTPSFHVNPVKQVFYCFGCKAGGNAVEFVVRRDRVQFREALEILARRAGLEMPGGGPEKRNAGERQALFDAHSAACAFFENQLSHPQAGLAARQYLEQRGFTAPTLKAFRVGLALDAWDALLKSPLLRKFPPGLLAMGGLVRARDHGDGHYDTFRNRIMFPIRDESGRIIAFGGRVAPGSTDPAKYLNSPESPLFSKSRAVFGIDLARQKIVETRTAVVVEGYTDVLMAHQFGCANVVSVLGTALTPQHVSLLRRFADRIVLLFDADAAGDAAAARVMQLFLSQPVEIAVASLPDGLDPDEYLLRHGPEAFARLIADAPDALEHLWTLTQRRFSQTKSLTAQQQTIQEFLDVLGEARSAGPVDSLRWATALARVQRLTEIPLSELHRRFSRGKRQAGRPGPPPGQAEPNGPAASAGLLTPSERLPAERHIMGALLLEPAAWSEVQARLAPEAFEDEQVRRLAEVYWDHQRHEGEPQLKQFLTVLGELGISGLALELVNEIEQLGNLRRVLDESIETLWALRRRKEEEQIVRQLRREGGGGDEEAELLRRLQERVRTPDLRRQGKPASA